MTNSKYPKQGEDTSKVDKLREIIRNTEENIKETEFSEEFAHTNQSVIMNQKNARRKESIKELKEELKEELEKK